MDARARLAQALKLKPVKKRPKTTLAEYAVHLQDREYLQQMVKFEQTKRLPKLLPGPQKTVARVIRYELLRDPAEKVVLSMGRSIEHPEIWIALAGLEKA